MAAMVIAAGSVIKEPRIGATINTLNHQAAGVPFPIAATLDISPSAKRSTGRLAAIAMITTTKSGSVKILSLFR